MHPNKKSKRGAPNAWIDSINAQKQSHGLEWGNGILPSPIDITMQSYQPAHQNNRRIGSQMNKRNAAAPTPVKFSSQMVGRDIGLGEAEEFPPALGEEIYAEPMNQVFLSVLSTTSLLLLTFAWFRAGEGIFTDLTKQLFGDNNNLIGQAVITTVVVMIVHQFIRSQSELHQQQLSSTYRKQQSFFGI